MKSFSTGLAGASLLAFVLFILPGMLHPHSLQITPAPASTATARPNA
jgi:hypothetical protein